MVFGAMSISIINELLQIFIILLVAGSTTIICIKLFNPIFKHSFPAKWQYLIRKLALFFYLVPFSFIVQRITLFLSEQPIVPVESEYYLRENNLEQYVPFKVAIVILGIWILGAVILSTWYLYCYCRFKKEIQKNCLSIPDDSEIYTLFDSCKKTMGIKKNIKLMYNYELESPAIVGLFSTTIMLPIKEMSDSDLTMVLRHELIHFKRNDLWTKFFVLIASSLHWFNPFVHILRKEIHKWSELSCDEEVVKEMSYIDRKQYGLTILKMTKSSNNKSDSFFVFLSGGKKDLERRLTMLLKVKKVSKPILIIGITFITITGIVGTTTATWAAQNTPNVVTNQEVNQIDLNDKKEEIISNESDVSEIISVKKTDEERFRPEVWEKILSKIKTGEIVWED